MSNTATNYRILRHTLIPCDICKNLRGVWDIKWRVTKVETCHGDPILRCFHCNKMTWWLEYTTRDRVAACSPFDEISFDSTDEAFERSCQVIHELTT